MTKHSLPVALTIAAVWCASLAYGAAPSETVLFSFNGIDGAYPAGSVIFDQTGNLYGVTSRGGQWGSGSVFIASPPQPGQTAWSPGALYYFPIFANLDGAPAGLLRDSSGNLYGTSAAGPHSSNGMVFRMSPPSGSSAMWTETTLYTFNGKRGDGYGSGSNLVADSVGNLYGVTNAEGATNSHGSVFKLSPPAFGSTRWTETVLYAFKGGNDGAYPLAGLVFDSRGNLYGTTGEGGGFNVCAGGCGTVFELSPPAAGSNSWKETILHAFSSPDGSQPMSQLVIDSAGKLYGTTYHGGASGLGVVFRLARPARGTTAWTESILHSFGGTDGAEPQAGLVRDAVGNLYGTTSAGGSSSMGTVFELSPPPAGSPKWNETVLHSFGGSDGQTPTTKLFLDSAGRLYGTTYSGGSTTLGTVFEVTP